MGRKSLSIEQNLILLSAAALVLFLALAGTLLFVQSALEGTQDKMNHTVLPAEEAVVGVQSAVAALFEFEAAALSTHSVADLDKLGAAGVLRERLAQSVAALTATLTPAEQERLAPAMASAVDRFVKSDSELEQRIKARHLLQADFERGLQQVQVELRGLIEAAQSISGRVRLDFIVKLRQIAQGLGASGLDATGTHLVREVILGDSRATLDTVTELVGSVLSLGVVSGKLGLARSEDDLNAILANELIQNRTKIEKSIDAVAVLAAAMGGDGGALRPAAAPSAAGKEPSGLEQRAQALKDRFQPLALRIGDEADKTSLAALRREIFHQDREAAVARAAGRDAADALRTSVASTSSEVRSVVSAFQEATRTAARSSKWISALVSLLGIVLCAIAGVSIRHSVRDLRRTNAELAELRDSLKAANAGLELKIEQRTRAIRTILDNVSFGLLRTGADLLIHEGHSRSTATLLGASGDLSGQSLSKLLGMTAQEADHFYCLYEQIFDDIGPEDLTLSQLPARFHHGDRTLSLAGSVVRDADGAVESVLFSVADISSLDKAEREVAESRGLLKILSARNRFKLCLGEVTRSLPVFVRALEQGRNKNNEEAMRRALHTWKGNFSLFGLNDLTSYIHAIEGHEAIDAADLHGVRDHLQGYLQKHATLLGLSYDGTTEESFEVPDSAFTNLAAKVSGAKEGPAVTGIVMDFMAAMRQKKARDLLGSLEEASSQLAARLGKRVAFRLEGGEILLPVAFNRIAQIIPHLLRNAIDHGIETPAARGSKPRHGQITLRIMPQGGVTRFILEDDGRGIDVEALVAKGIAMGLVSKEDAAKLTQQQRLDLIYHPGLSTVDQVTDISGRGVGMNAVRDAVLQAGGTIDIATRCGEGTVFTLAFPSGSGSDSDDGQRMWKKIA